MNWNKFTKDTLGPYGKLGNAAKTFNGETKIFSYMAIRHIALLAYKAGVAASQQAVESETKNRPRLICQFCGKDFTVDEAGRRSCCTA